MRRKVETAFGLALAGAGAWIAISSAPVISTQVLLLVIVLVGTGGFFVSKSLMGEVVRGALSVIRTHKGE